MRLKLADAAATEALGGQLAAVIEALRPPRLMLHLEGDLGAGKTTFARGLLAGMGHEGRVPSPTYTLVEPYVLGGYALFHVDLYRLREPGELEHLGLLDQLGDGSLALVEWPGHGAGCLPAADLRLCFAVAGSGRMVELEALSPAGEVLCAALEPLVGWCADEAE